MSKGSGRRPTQISSQEEDLRWELINPKTTKKRKKAILALLEKLKEEKIKQ